MTNCYAISKARKGYVMRTPSKTVFYKMIKSNMQRAYIFPDGRTCHIYKLKNFKNETYYRLLGTNLNPKCFDNQFHKTLKEAINTACLAYLDEL